jgi:N-acetylneuraminic acid mutarotase
VKTRIRSAAASLLFLVCLVTLTSAFKLPNNSPDLSPGLASLSTSAKPVQQRTKLTLADRVAYQRGIEDVYWRHRIWPKERPDPKPSLDEVMPPAQLEMKVEDYLRNSQALEDYWQKPISAEQLQAEMERMARQTKQPDVLRELFAALGNDPFVIAECLARPALSERLVTNFYAHDQRFHGKLRQRAEADLRAHHTVRQMKETSGQYSEIEFVRSDSGEDQDNGDAETGVKMNSRDWEENVQKLAAIFGDAKNGPVQLRKSSRAELPVAPTTQIKTGVLSPLQEDEHRYYATAVLKKSKDHLKLATLEWRKEPLESWKSKAENQMPHTMAAVSAKYTLPTISGSGGASGCTDDTWTLVSQVPSGRFGYTEVWTGTEMIVWGGLTSDDSYSNTGGRYNPSTDSWTATDTANAPSVRAYHTAVWTGSEMIVWGGDGDSGQVNTGGRYNPGTDTWTATNTTNAPSVRAQHTAVWTGSAMIVWGGYYVSGFQTFHLNTGGKYNPTTDSWTATGTINAPAGRISHTAVWSGSEMIVWGGDDGMSSLLSGGRYSPATDNWTTTSINSAPTGRSNHTSVWTGSEMIIWGGISRFGGVTNTGGKYDPATDTWLATSTTNAPTARYGQTAVWTGSEMIIWGGTNDGTGGRYNPSTDSWTATSTTNAPRTGGTAVWTGTEMIVWGGSTGGRYNPGMDSWTSIAGVPSARADHTTVWTGTEMIIWGGFASNNTLFNTGGRYNPSTDSWTATSTSNAPSSRSSHTAVWTGTEMIVWGGAGNQIFFNSGGRYNPSTDTWLATNLTNAPTARVVHTAVWTGTQMIVWGGRDSNNNNVGTGGRYNPSTDTWLATNLTNAPTGRSDHTAVWTGNNMIIWGGDDGSNFFNTGGRYDPSTDNWTFTSTTNAPSGRKLHTAVWTGSEMIIWGGTPDLSIGTGGRYNPGTDSWTVTNTTNAPAGRDYHTAVWTGNQMIVWGGEDINFVDLNTGGRYNPSADSWTATNTTNAPSGREFHTAIWSGSEMIVWGGEGPRNGNAFDTGGRYCAQSQAPMAQSAFSRKIHGAAGTFDIPLPLTGNVGIECRSGGATNDYQMIINFASSVTVGSASVTSGTGSVSSLSGSGTSQITVNLTGITNVQRITVTLFNVNDGTHMGNVPVSMGVLVGDVNGNGSVNSSDVGLDKSQVGQAVTMSNFREDVNASGTITATDVAIVKSEAGTSLPPQ